MSVLERTSAKIRMPPTTILGFVLLLVYLTFALIAFASYPQSFTPFGNWLSDLGNRDLNPAGAWSYIAGCIITGLFIIAFFVSLRVWLPSGTRRQGRQVVWIQVFGSAAGVALIMTAVFPEDLIEAHSLWNQVLFGSLAPAMFLSMWAFRRSGHSIRALITVSGAAYLADLAWFLFNDVFWLQWLTVGLVLVYVLLVALATSNILRKAPRTSAPNFRLTPAGRARAATITSAD